MRCPLTSHSPPGMLLSSHGGLRATIVRTCAPLRGQFGIAAWCTGPGRTGDSPMTGPLRPCVTKVLRVLTCLGGLLPTAAVGQTIVWTDANARRIQRKDVNGGEIKTIVQFPSPQAAYQIHYDPITAKLYYLFYAPPTSFQRANLDGSEPENIPTPSVGNFALNVELRKLYWSNLATIYRSELNGSGVESHTYPSCCLGLPEAVGDDLYLAGSGGAMLKGIWRADADGSNEQFLHGSGQPLDLAYDPVEGKLYWASVDGIYRMNSEGTDFRFIVELLDTGVNQVVVDRRGRKVYWAVNPAKIIQRSNLDGANVEDFVTASNVGNPNFDIQGLTIVYNSTPIPTLSGWGVMTTGVLVVVAGLVVLRKRLGAKQDGSTLVADPASPCGASSV